MTFFPNVIFFCHTIEAQILEKYFNFCKDFMLLIEKIIIFMIFYYKIDNAFSIFQLYTFKYGWSKKMDFSFLIIFHKFSKHILLHNWISTLLFIRFASIFVIFLKKFSSRWKFTKFEWKCVRSPCTLAVRKSVHIYTRIYERETKKQIVTVQVKILIANELLY